MMLVDNLIHSDLVGGGGRALISPQPAAAQLMGLNAGPQGAAATSRPGRPDLGLSCRPPAPQHPGNILVRLEPPTGLLGLAHRALSKVLDVAGGGACSDSGSGISSSSSDTGSSSGAPEPGPPLCKASGSGDAAACVSSSGSGGGGGGGGDGSTVVVPAVSEVKRRRAKGASSSDRLGGSEADADSAHAAGPRLSLPPRLRAALAALHASWLQPRIVLLDVGMATELSGEDQKNMVGLFRAFSQLEGAAAADWILRFSGEGQGCAAPDAFRCARRRRAGLGAPALGLCCCWLLARLHSRSTPFGTQHNPAARRATTSTHLPHPPGKRRDMEATFQELKTANASAGGWGGTSFDSGADALAAVLEHVRVHGVTLPGHICAVVVTTLILEGWSNK
jgi:hypothetical protein